MTVSYTGVLEDLGGKNVNVGVFAILLALGGLQVCFLRKKMCKEFPKASPLSDVAVCLCTSDSHCSRAISGIGTVSPNPQNRSDWAQPLSHLVA